MTRRNLSLQDIYWKASKQASPMGRYGVRQGLTCVVASIEISIVPFSTIVLVNHQLLRVFQFVERSRDQFQSHLSPEAGTLELMAS